MTAAQRAMTTWMGALSKSGVLPLTDAEAGEAVAAYVVGEDRMAELRAFFETADPADSARQRRAAVRACIAMAQSDRDVHPEERHLLRSLVAHSGLDADTQDELVMLVHEPEGLEGLEDELTHPVLRELMLALVWELALADGRVDDSETAFYRALAAQLEVDAERAAEIADSVAERLA